MSTARELSFSRNGKSIVIAPQAMTKAMAAASTCQDDLLRSWSADPAVEAKISWRPSIVSPEKSVTYDDYPVVAMREGVEGDTVFRLSLDRTGRVIDCKIVVSAGHEALVGKIGFHVHDHVALQAVRPGDAPDNREPFPVH